jgi:16S rRNA C967 or C1407 C5-methylase (RsmB/RsmF family)/NOL1/NOP2/fmu family ribosome biogenesis protein
MALPADFITRTRALLGDEFEALRAAIADDAQVSIRLNDKKLQGRGLKGDFERVAWSGNGFYLPERLSFTFDPAFHAGGYYVQEASSMFLERAIKQYAGNEPVRCLDLCAAPGGKSTLLLQALPEGSLLVSNEVIKNRSNILAENLAKWGNPNKIVCNNDPKQVGELRDLFDIVVADVPCSGEGMFRKDTDSTGEWSVANVELCASRQRRIINDVWDALRPGGLLIYSTCTYNLDENEENINYIVNELGTESLSVETNPEWNITGALKYDNHVYRFMPHKTKGEGFFLAVLRKQDGERLEIKIKNKSKDKKKQSVVIPETFKKISNETHTAIELNGNFVYSLPESVAEVYPLIKEKLYVISAGICMGESKGKDVIPSQELALWNELPQDIFPTVDVDWDTAIKYLKRETLSFTDAPKGYLLLRYDGLNLGFVKNIGNRANNLYPQEWRIRTGHTPDEITTLPI